ncbi:anaerobic ribonucleoside triphosphate reductase [Erysipelotrichaceae bacterium]|nr:anaerobic ribonucleoside triphosphate reductase [Erysipelotrichaceae bacterium]
MIKIIVKRDGSEENFAPEKIKQAIISAFRASDCQYTEDAIQEVYAYVLENLPTQKVSVEQIQDTVEHALMHNHPDIAKRFILYREWRTTERAKRTSLKKIMDGIVSVEANDVNNENANMSAHTPAGQMMTFASEITKDYTHKYLLSPEISRLHCSGDIHIHDLDFYPTKTTTCLQYDLADLFERGLTTKNGSIRTPQSIQSYATLATIIFQTNQNEQHGGQSIPAFDYFMAPGVLKTFRKNIIEDLLFLASVDGKILNRNTLKKICDESIPSIKLDKLLLISLRNALIPVFDISLEMLSIMLDTAYTTTATLTHQAMEGFIHNLNTMHSRGGNQVVFSSINYGTDTSHEGRLVITELLKTTVKGLGRGETPVFPIQIFKVKDGISYSQNDLQLAYDNFPEALAGKLVFEAPNFDLLLHAVETTATSLFPNFVFLDTPFNTNPLWQENNPKRYEYELATMGCRTRVFENLHGPTQSLGRGNLSFTTLNFPRLAIVAKIEATEQLPLGTKNDIQDMATEIFLKKIADLATIVGEQLKDRLDYQKTALAKQFPFMMNNDVWKGGIHCMPNDKVGDVLNSGTLGIGFIGGHNAMVALYDEGHGTHEQSYQTLEKAIDVLNDVVAQFKQKYNLNYSVLATPAEGLSGRFTKLDQKLYGIIPGVTDRDYYINSFHIDVKEVISSFDKIRKEAPFHAKTLGGHITYVELDGEAKKNTKAILKLVACMHDNNIGYGSINHPVDTCRNCGYKGVMYIGCPLCESENITRMRRITGYLTGSLDTWNSAKRAEEKDRVMHSVRN